MRVILNPMARGGAGRAQRHDIETALADVDGGVEVVETQRSGHAVELARAAVRDGVRTVVAAGGDGTIHEVADGLLQAMDEQPAGDVALGIIPIGTGNDFAKILPGIRTRDEALTTLRTGVARPVDVGIVQWRGGREYFLNAMGTGVDVEVVRQIQLLSRGTGALVYMQGLLRALRRYRPLPVTITADGADLSARVMMVAVANGSCIGGMFRIAPDARPDDGQLDLCVVSEMPLLAQLAIVPRIIAGTHQSSSRVRSRRVQAISIGVDGGGPMFFQLDGELREPGDVGPLRVTIQPGRLQIIAAQAATSAAGVAG